MQTLVHHTVATDCSNYTFKTREEAEAFFMAVSIRERHRHTSLQNRSDGSPPTARDVRRNKRPQDR